MDEEKTIDDEKTVDEAVEEMTDEMKEFEPVAFDEVVKETEPERKDAPVLRDAPEPADMNMIHKHLDNFLAKIAGETPIDETVRDSTEYWLKRIADVVDGKQTQLYEHSGGLYTPGGSNIRFTAITENSTAFLRDTLEAFIKNLPGDHILNCVGVITLDGGVTYYSGVYAITWVAPNFKVYYTDSSGYHSETIGASLSASIFSNVTDNVRAL